MKQANLNKSSHIDRPVSPVSQTKSARNHKTVLVTSSQELPQTNPSPVKKSNYQDNLKQSCKIYRHLEKIFNKLLDNHAATSKLQRGLATIFEEELQYVRKVIQKMGIPKTPEEFKEATVNNLFIFKENLKIFMSLMVENQYEEFASRIKLEQVKLDFHVPKNEDLSKSLNNFKAKTMEKIEEEAAEEVIEISDSLSDHSDKLTINNISSIHKKQVSKSPNIRESWIKQTVTFDRNTIDENHKSVQQTHPSKSAIYVSSSKQMPMPMYKPASHLYNAPPRKNDHGIPKIAYKNYKEVGLNSFDK